MGSHIKLKKIMTNDDNSSYGSDDKNKIDIKFGISWQNIIKDNWKLIYFFFQKTSLVWIMHSHC